jgi:iron complex outermembrane receptor protein
MSVRFTRALCATAAIVGLTGGAQSTFAQTDQPAASSGSGLEEIVVTARRKEERVQTVPIAITAFSQKDIEAKRILQISDLAKNVPSLASNQNQSDANAFYSGQIRLRGLPGTVIYFADVPLGSVDYNPTNGITHGTSTGLFYDLDNVEIIKGPQGTLFGKNSIGGLISLEPKKPTNEFEGYAQVKFGNYSDREFEGAVNIPIIADKLMVRIAGQSQQRDGYTKDVSNGKDYDNRDYYSWRVGVTFRPTDDIENYFLYDGYYQHTNGSATIPTYYNLGFTFAQIPLGPNFSLPLTLGQGPALAGLFNPATAGATVGQAIAAGGFSFFPNAGALLAQQKALGVRAVTGRSTPGIGKDYFYGFTNTTMWNLSDDLTIKNVAAARIFKQLTSNDDNSSPLPILNIGDPINNKGWNDNSVQYTEEIQLQGKAFNEKLAWVLGGFLEFDHPLGYNTDPSSALGGLSIYHFHETNRSQAVFAHGIYDLGDYVSGLRLTAGYRYTFDYQSLQEHGYKVTDFVTRNPNGTPNNCAPISFFDNNCAAGSNAHFSSYGWNVSLDEQLDPNTLIYVRAGNAYRPGGTNPQVPAAFQSIKPEHVTDVEIGAKVDWDFMGAHFRTNGDLFHSDYKSIQVTQLVSVPNPNDPNGPPTAASLETNAASATLEGAELEITAIPVPGIEISPHASYLYSHYDKYPTVFGAAEAPPFFYEPKWQVGVTGTYHLPLDSSIGDVSVSASYSFEGHQYVAPNGGDIFNVVPSYDNLDIRADWTDMFGYPLDGAFFMTNVMDDTHVQAVLPLYTQLGFTALVYNEPRMFGFSLKYRFGGDSEPESTPAAYTPPPVIAPAPSVPKSYLVFFDFNKSDLTSQAVSIVDQAAKNAGPAKVTKLEVTGHTDTVGSDAYNMRLSRRRAESVAAQLEKDGIPSSEIEIVAKGKRDLLVPTADGVKEPQNRRVQIVYQGGPVS